MSVKVYHYTIGRSGSTFISQILRSLFGRSRNRVIAGHDAIFLKKNEPLVITIRDFRDTLVSRWRVINNILPQHIDEGRKVTDSELDMLLDTLCIYITTKLNPTYDRNKNILLMRYEDFFPDKFEFIFDEFERFFNIKISINKREEIKRKYSLEANKEKQSKLTWFTEYDKDYIHGQHIYKGEIGTWKNLVPHQLHIKLNNKLLPHLEKWGYKV